MSTSGGTPAYVKPAAGRLYMLGGNAALSGAAPTAGSMRLYPILNPYAVAFTALGVNVTTAGDVASTLTPVFYDVDAFGNPRSLIITGPALSGGAIAQVNGAQAGTIPAGQLWAGALCLSPATVPTVTSLSKSDHDARGPWAPTDNATGATVLAFQSGLAAPPAGYGGTYISGSAPLIFVTT